jgi:large subunit ribosomal protein L4
MPTIDIYDIEKNKVGEMALADNVFNVEVREHLVHEAVKVYLANKRAGTVAVKNRAAVAGSGKKPFRQKGTGQARQGCSRAPQYPGGGVAFGPKPKEYNLSMNKKARKSALKSVLSYQYKENLMTVLNDVNFENISTKDFVNIFKGFDKERFLLVLDEENSKVELSARNLKYVRVLQPESLNVYDILDYKHIIFTEAAVRKVEGALQP